MDMRRISRIGLTILKTRVKIHSLFGENLKNILKI